MASHEESLRRALRSTLETARENEKRWLAMSAEFSSDAEQMEQWRSTARLRHREVERLEALLAEGAPAADGFPVESRSEGRVEGI
jgi:predicted component of type VI protein secretion system